MTTVITENASTTGKKIGPRQKSRRRFSRELALQGIYQWRIAGGTASFIEDQLRENDEFNKADTKYFTNLLHGVIENSEKLQQEIQPCLDRSFNELSPVEYSIILLSTYELINHPEIPYRAVLNEAVELARSYGSSDGYKYVNGVLDKLAVRLRATEIGSQSQAKT